MMVRLDITQQAKKDFHAIDLKNPRETNLSKIFAVEGLKVCLNKNENKKNENFGTKRFDYMDFNFTFD